MAQAEMIFGFIHLVVNADGMVKPKEIELANKMLQTEKLSNKDAQTLLMQFNTLEREVVFNSSLKELKKLDKANQIKFVAWLCVIANADGFMDQEEWALIYQIYHKELGLQTNEVMARQKEINTQVLNKSTTSFGIRVND